jgi:hypothetical protein
MTRDNASRASTAESTWTGMSLVAIFVGYWPFPMQLQALVRPECHAEFANRGYL